MPYDPGVIHQALDIVFSEAGDFFEIETSERAAEILSFSQNGEPTQAGLESLEADLLEEAEVVGDFPSPLPVMILDIVVVSPRPEAA